MPLGWFAIILLHCAIAGAASPSSWIGERHELEVSWIGLSGLRLTLEVLPPTDLDRKPAYHFRAMAEHSPWLGIFFRVNNLAESFVDPQGFFSRRFLLKQDQSNLERLAEESHDPHAGKTVYRNRVRKRGQEPSETLLTVADRRRAQDSFSAFFFLRTLTLAPGQTTIVPVTSEGQYFDVLVTVLGEEEVLGFGETYRTLAMKLQKLADGKPAEGGNHRVWLSADERRFLVRADVGTRLGAVSASLVKYTPAVTSPAPR